MCVILDTNRFSDFLNDPEGDFKPVRDWIEKNGKLAYSPTPKIKGELSRHQKMFQWYRTLQQNSKLKFCPKEKVIETAKSLTDLKSDDADIVALAMESETQLLVSGDKRLHADFKTIIGGKIYQGKDHIHLLHGYNCP